MNQNKIDRLIIKLIENNISEEESVVLKEWLQDENNLEYFNEFIEINHLINSKNEFDYRSSLERIKESLSTKKKNKLVYLYKYAAAILIFVSAGYFFLNKEKPQVLEPVIVNSNIKIGTDKATLTLEDGTDVILEKGEQYVLDNLESNGEDIIYKQVDESKSEIAYNYLTIPRGGQYHVKLADETEVWLNSESKLKYPTSFIDGEVRKVELVYGEAYFIVSPSTEHKGSNFKVKTGIQEIEVLGTQFNVKAYSEEDQIYTTLVEGKVSIDNTNSLEILKPNQQSILNIASKEIQINTIDVNSEIAWIHGDFIFNRKPLKDIMKVLSRWYDVEVEFENKALEDSKFFGELSKHQSIEDILTLIKTTNTINSFEINKNKILIK